MILNESPFLIVALVVSNLIDVTGTVMYKLMLSLNVVFLSAPLSSASQVILTNPGPINVTKPLAGSTSATFGLDDLHVTFLLTPSSSDVFSGVISATN